MQTTVDLGGRGAARARGFRGGGAGVRPHLAGRASNAAEDDVFLKKIVLSGAPAACIFGKTWDLHVTTALNISLEENLDVISSSVKFLKDSGLEVFFDAEHFFDGYKKNPEYSAACSSTSVTAPVP